MKSFTGRSSELWTRAEASDSIVWNIVLTLVREWKASGVWQLRLAFHLCMSYNWQWRLSWVHSVLRASMSCYLWARLVPKRGRWLRHLVNFLFSYLHLQV